MNTVHTLTLLQTYSVLPDPGTISPRGAICARPRRCFPVLWGGDEQTAPGTAAAGKPNSPDPDQDILIDYLSELVSENNKIATRFF